MDAWIIWHQYDVMPGERMVLRDSAGVTILTAWRALFHTFDAYGNEIVVTMEGLASALPTLS